ncbi:MAG TPA: hypothetical protein VLJ41_17110 [Segetibacter sp.]|nr:hypothetical protein [Segetibacter sp.]
MESGSEKWKVESRKWKVESDHVANPKGVRFAWRNISNHNFYSKARFPASPV